jgi:hypothetical protein
MIYAIITNNTIIAHGNASDLWLNTSFGLRGPHPSFLIAAGAVVVRSDVPYDPATEILQSCAPYLLDGKVFDTIATPIPAPPPPAPDWERFKRIAMTSSVFTSIATAVPPQSISYLTASFIEAEKGETQRFRDTWNLVVHQAGVPPEVLAGFAGIAVACHLPAEFVAALNPRLASAD